MNSYRTNHRERRTLRLWSGTTLVIVVLLADSVSGGGVRAIVREVAASLSSSMSGLFDALKHSGMFDDRARLADRVRALEEELASAQTQALLYQALKQDREELAGFARLATTTPGRTAPVVSSFAASPYATFLIGAGEAEHIAHGDLVVTEDGFAIGIVTEAGEHTSVVRLILAPGNDTIDGLVAGASVPWTGTGGGNARALIPREITVAVGDIVTAPTARAHPIGIVGHVESDPASAYRTVYLRIPRNIETLRYVYIVPHQ